MVSRQRAALNTIALTVPLASALLYAAFFDSTLPNGIIMPIAAGGIMNLGFWLFYRDTIGPLRELSRSMLWKKDNFLVVGMLHFAVIPIPLLFDISWIFGLF